MRGAKLLALFSPLVVVVIFVAGYFVLGEDEAFNPYRYVGAREGNPSLPVDQGVYLSTPRGFLELMPFDSFDPDPPQDLLPRIPRQETGPLIVYRRTLEPPERYKVFEMSHGQEMEVEWSVIPQATAARLTPRSGRWPVATYGVSVPKEGLASGSDWYYFTIVE